MSPDKAIDTKALKKWLVRWRKSHFTRQGENPYSEGVCDGLDYALQAIEQLERGEPINVFEDDKEPMNES